MILVTILADACHALGPKSGLCGQRADPVKVIPRDPLGLGRKNLGFGYFLGKGLKIWSKATNILGFIP